jgi:hypothetical protein
MIYSRSDIFAILGCIAFVAAGVVTSAEPHKNLVVWFFGIGAVVLLAGPWLRRRKQVEVSRTATQERVEFDDHEIRRFLPDGRKESILWRDLHYIHIMTTSEGPWVDDVFWLFLNADQSGGCAISNGAAGFPELLKKIQLLHGFDNEAVALAMGRTDNGRFIVWEAAAQGTSDDTGQNAGQVTAPSSP